MYMSGLSLLLVVWLSLLGVLVQYVHVQGGIPVFVACAASNTVPVNRTNRLVATKGLGPSPSQPHYLHNMTFKTVLASHASWINKLPSISPHCSINLNRKTSTNT